MGLVDLRTKKTFGDLFNPLWRLSDRKYCHRALRPQFGWLTSRQKRLRSY